MDPRRKLFAHIGLRLREKLGPEVDDFLNEEIERRKIMDWDKAKEHFDKMRKIYQELEGAPGVNTTLALRLTFDPLSIRYNNGERSEELYNEMMSAE